MSLASWHGLLYVFCMFCDTHHNEPCSYCQRPMDRKHFRLRATRDHYLPKKHGGKGKGDVICCAACNETKGDMLPAAWRAFMVRHPQWWLLTKKELRDIRRAALGLPTVRKARRARIIQRLGRVVATVVPANLIYRASQPATERNDQ